MAPYKNFKPVTIKQGFSLIEVLISFTILSISLIAITQLITTTIQANRQNTSRLQAYYLAEQGIELSRHVRDSNWLQNIGFDSAGHQNTLWQSNNGTTANITPQTKNLIIDIQNSTLGTTQKNVTLAQSQNANNNLYLNTDPQTNIKYFSHQRNSSSIPTEFRRTIHITNNFSDFQKLEKHLDLNDYDLSKNLILIESTVEYGNNYEKEIKLQTILTDWKEGPF
jgi:prepilin-type N-terminal cleavage/methylation domain-containing protein